MPPDRRSGGLQSRTRLPDRDIQQILGYVSGAARILIVDGEEEPGIVRAGICRDLRVGTLGVSRASSVHRRADIERRVEPESVDHRSCADRLIGVLKALHEYVEL